VANSGKDVVPRRYGDGVPLRLFYVDDSGSVSTGLIVYSWIECAVDEWREGLRQWLELRRDLYARHRIPPSYELHSSQFVNGRGRPSTDPAWNLSKQARWAVAEEMLATIGACPQLRVGTVYRRTADRGHAYHRQRDELYEELILHLDARLAGRDELGMVFMDGDGSAAGYYAAHRGLKLAHRRVIEDPLFQASHRSQWVQMADLTAYTAYHALLRHPAKAFLSGWYERYLLRCDTNAGPLAL
jgi:hypothetical protein